jgi:hypothetical protein
MKKIIFFLLAIAMVLPVFSQEDHIVKNTSSDEQQMKTLFGNKDQKHAITLGYFMEMNAGYTQFDKRNVFLPGISFGMILNHNWSVGLTGSAVANPGNLYYNDIYNPDSYSATYGANLVGGYGGALFEYTAFPRSVVHFSIPVMVGGGYFAYVDDYIYGNDFTFNGHSMDYHTIDYNVCFVVEPGIKVEFNLIKMLRLGLGVSYRYSPNFELVKTSTGLINQFTGRLSLRFGKF